MKEVEKSIKPIFYSSLTLDQHLTKAYHIGLDALDRDSDTGQVMSFYTNTLSVFDVCSCKSTHVFPSSDECLLSETENISPPVGEQPRLGPRHGLAFPLDPSRNHLAATTLLPHA